MSQNREMERPDSKPVYQASSSPPVEGDRNAIGPSEEWGLSPKH
jgi:hypothetical protein